MLTIEQISKMTKEALADYFAGHSIEHIKALYDTISDALDALDEQGVDFVESKDHPALIAFETFLAALPVAKVAENSNRYDEVVAYIGNVILGEGVRLTTEIESDLLRVGYHPEYATILAQKLLQLPEDEAVATAVMECAIIFIHRNPDAYRYPLNQLPIEVQDHFDKIEQICKQVAKLECFANVYRISANDVSGSDNPNDMLIAAIRFEHKHDNKSSFNFVMPMSCLENGQHWLEDHREDINNRLMQFIAQFV